MEGQAGQDALSNTEPLEVAKDTEVRPGLDIYNDHDLTASLEEPESNLNNGQESDQHVEPDIEELVEVSPEQDQEDRDLIDTPSGDATKDVRRVVANLTSD